MENLNEHRVTVFGAYGHTANFVIAELRRREFTPILAGRDALKLRAASEAHPREAHRRAHHVADQRL